MTTYSVDPPRYNPNEYAQGEILTSHLPIEFGGFTAGMVQALRAIDFGFDYRRIPANELFGNAPSELLRPQDKFTLRTAAGLFIKACGAKPKDTMFTIAAGKYGQQLPDVHEDDYHLDGGGQHMANPTFVAIVNIGPLTDVLHGRVLADDITDTIESAGAKPLSLTEGVFYLLTPTTGHKRPSKPAVPQDRIVFDYRNSSSKMRIKAPKK